MLDLMRVPAAKRGLQVVKNWIHDLFYTLRPWTNELEHFLTLVAEMINLGLQFDRHSAQIYISRAPCVASDRPKDLLRGGDARRYIVHDLFNFVDGSPVSAISAGVLFVMCVCI